MANSARAEDGWTQAMEATMKLNLSPKTIRYAETGVKTGNAIAAGVAAGWMFKKGHPILGTIFVGIGLANAFASEVVLVGLHSPSMAGLDQNVSVEDEDADLQAIMDSYCQDPEGTQKRMSGQTGQLAEDFRSIISAGTYTCG